MGLLDVTELLLDPLFIEDFTVVRSISGVSERGFQTEKKDEFKVSGSIQADSGFTLNRLPELARIEGSAIVYTTWELTEGKGLIEADILINDRGQRFTITKVRDWGNYGQGYIEASLDVLDVANDGEPAEQGDPPYMEWDDDG